MELAEARRLIREAGYRPYIRKVKGREYITLKRGSKEVGVGPFSQDIWESLESEWTLAVYGPKAPASRVPQQQTQATRPKLDELDIARVFELLDAGYDQARIVRETLLHPDAVEYATKRYMELKKLNPRAIVELGDAVSRVLNEVVAPLAEKISACARFRQRSCDNFEEGVCRRDWDASILEMVPKSAKLFEVVKEFEGFWGGKYLHIKPTEIWCLACPFFERKI